MGAILGAAGNLILAVADGGATSVGVVVTGGGAGVVVSVMAWIVKKVVSGEVVPIPIKALLDAMEERDRKTEQLLEQLCAERSEHKDMIRSSTEANFAVYEYLREQGASTRALHPGAAPSRREG